MVYEQEVLVVGAGPTGLTLAVDLARRGVRVRIVDAATEPSRGSRGKGIQPRTQEIFDLLGVMPEIAQVGGLYQRLRFHWGPFSFRGGSLGTRHAPTEAMPYPNLLQVPQFKTEGVLRARLASLGVSVEFGRRFESFVQRDDGVDVTLSDGVRVRCAFLVGCDGGRSAVRKALGFGLVGSTVEDKTLLVGDVNVEGLSRADWHVWPWARGGMLGLCPMPHSDFFQVTCPKVEDVAGLIESVTKCRVSEVLTSSSYTPQARMVQRYRAGRVFLAGDAAHLHPPTGGQGLNTGVQDAWNLGWKLAWALRGGPDSILDSYQAERLPVAAAVLNLSRTLYVNRSMKRGALTNQLGLHYRESALSSGVPMGELHPGDRMPDGRLPNGQRVFDVLRHPGATLLARGDSKVLVRPDGYIASIGRDDVDHYAGMPVLRVSA
ncbi:FAD-dependent monooxygenase [Myxococcaceae bacterium JPH2]|nr:FAD-dependent monooxygenase [Myxococcaceae bacterium JPH2]